MCWLMYHRRRKALPIGEAKLHHLITSGYHCDVCACIYTLQRMERHDVNQEFPARVDFAHSRICYPTTTTEESCVDYLMGEINWQEFIRQIDLRESGGLLSVHESEYLRLADMVNNGPAAEDFLSTQLLDREGKLANEVEWEVDTERLTQLTAAVLTLIAKRHIPTSTD